MVKYNILKSISKERVPSKERAAGFKFRVAIIVMMSSDEQNKKEKACSAMEGAGKSRGGEISIICTAILQK